VETLGQDWKDDPGSERKKAYDVTKHKINCEMWLCMICGELPIK